jgi:hypothetical protein
MNALWNQILNAAITMPLRARKRRFEQIVRQPEATQRRVLEMLLSRGRTTRYGHEYRFGRIRNYEDYRRQVPIVTYEELFPYIERALRGEAHVLWPGKVQWFAKSSGTTNDRSKFIPLTPESLNLSHYKAGRDLLGTYLVNNPDSQLFAAKNLSVGGSHELGTYGGRARTGDLSAVLIENMPALYESFRSPSKAVALMGDWEQKMDAMAHQTMAQRISSVSGVPTWTQVLCERILELSGKQNMNEVWPSLELFFHGGVSFAPYRERFRALMPAPNMSFMEVYNASEGFIAMQNDPKRCDLLMMLDHGIFYEFLPLDEDGSTGKEAVPLEGVVPGRTYALVISTVSGLWRYQIGDTVRITETQPFKLVISGRTKHYINAFGEELMIDNADAAIAEACLQTGALVRDYTAGPIYLSAKGSGAHEWIIEFQQEPADRAYFARVMDDTLRRVNSDYDAKRSHDFILAAPKLHYAEAGTFYEWMRLRGKLGGQNKVPRLSNDRSYLEGLFEVMAHAKVRQ